MHGGYGAIPVSRLVTTAGFEAYKLRRRSQNASSAQLLEQAMDA